MIPILMCPVLNRWDLANRLLESIDHPVERILIIDNGMRGPDFLARPDVRVHTPPYTGMGYGGAINFMISQTPELPWWMWASNDVEFEPGHLATVAQRMEEATGPRIVTGGFTWAAVNRALVDTIGLIDEWSFFPIYYDDNDYAYRAKVAGVEWIEDWGRGSRHGDGIHEASLTIRSDIEAKHANDRSFVLNGSAYIEKWGGPVGHEKFESPWDSGMPVWVTRPSISGRQRRRW